LKPNTVYLTDDASPRLWSGIWVAAFVIGILDLETKIMNEIVSPRPWSNCMAPLFLIPSPTKMDCISS
jgi:hypothetical protein